MRCIFIRFLRSRSPRIGSSLQLFCIRGRTLLIHRHVSVQHSSHPSREEIEQRGTRRKDAKEARLQKVMRACSRLQARLLSLSASHTVRQRVEEKPGASGRAVQMVRDKGGRGAAVAERRAWVMD